VVKKGNRESSVSGKLPIIGADKKAWNAHVDLLKKIGYTTFVPALRQSTDFRSEGPGLRKKKRTKYSISGDVYYGVEDPSHEVVFSPKMVPRDKELERRDNLISTSPSLVKDEAVVQKMIELDYTAYLQRKASTREVIDRIASVASEITQGFPISFIGVGQDKEGFFPLFRTPDGDLPLNCLSQGTQSIIQWLAHLFIGYAEYYGFPDNLVEKPGILIIDDIDAHLHPSWQNRIIHAINKVFPNLQLFCSTHSPLMLTGLQAGQVHLLQREKDGKVSVSRNEIDIIGWSADEILRNFMEVRSPTDIGTAQSIERLQDLRNREKLSSNEKKELDSLKKQIHKDLSGGPTDNKLEELRTLLKPGAIKAASVRRKEQTSRKTGRAKTKK
jgi:hypothetical protein